MKKDRYSLCLAISNLLAARLERLNPGQDFFTYETTVWIPQIQLEREVWIQVHPVYQVRLMRQSWGDALYVAELALAPGLVGKMRSYLRGVGIRI